MFHTLKWTKYTDQKWKPNLIYFSYKPNSRYKSDIYIYISVKLKPDRIGRSDWEADPSQIQNNLRTALQKNRIKPEKQDKN